MLLETLRNRIGVGKIAEYLGISDRIFSDFSLLLIANIVTNIVNFIAYIIIARVFGHEIFGLFSIGVSVAMTALLFSEFGMELTMIRFYKMYEQDPRKSKAVLIVNFYFKCLMLVLLLLTSLIFSRSIGYSLTDKHDQTSLITIALFTGGILGFWSCLRASFQSLGLFKKIAHVTFFLCVY